VCVCVDEKPACLPACQRDMQKLGSREIIAAAIRLSLMKAEKLMSDETCSVLFLMCCVVWC
jgi:hypothetical protein